MIEEASPHRVPSEHLQAKALGSVPQTTQCLRRSLRANTPSWKRKRQYALDGSTLPPYAISSNKKDCQCIACLSAVRLGSETTESQPRSHPRICRTCQENRDCVRRFFVSSRNPQQAAAELSPHHLSFLHSERSKIAKNWSLCQVFSSVWVSASVVTMAVRSGRFSTFWTG